MPKISVIQINVTDMDQGIAFYSDKLGFEVASRKYYPRIVELAHDGAIVILLKVDKPVVIDYPNVAQTLINFEVDDLATKLEEFKEKGVNLIHEEPQPCPVGVFAAFRDPFGNVHELLEMH